MRNESVEEGSTLKGFGLYPKNRLKNSRHFTTKKVALREVTLGTGWLHFDREPEVDPFNSVSWLEAESERLASLRPHGAFPPPDVGLPLFTDRRRNTEFFMRRLLRPTPDGITWIDTPKVEADERLDALLSGVCNNREIASNNSVGATTAFLDAHRQNATSKKSVAQKASPQKKLNNVSAKSASSEQSSTTHLPKNDLKGKMTKSKSNQRNASFYQRSDESIAQTRYGSTNQPIDRPAAPLTEGTADRISNRPSYPQKGRTVILPSNAIPRSTSTISLEIKTSNGRHPKIRHFKDNKAAEPSQSQVSIEDSENALSSTMHSIIKSQPGSADGSRVRFDPEVRKYMLSSISSGNLNHHPQ